MRFSNILLDETVLYLCLIVHHDLILSRKGCHISTAVAFIDLIVDKEASSRARMTYSIKGHLRMQEMKALITTSNQST